LTLIPSGSSSAFNDDLLKLGLNISGAVGFEINGENNATSYDSGNVVHVDLATRTFLTKELSVGVLAGPLPTGVRRRRRGQPDRLVQGPGDRGATGAIPPA
jgi:hypothetical protein